MNLTKRPEGTHQTGRKREEEGGLGEVSTDTLTHRILKYGSFKKVGFLQTADAEV